MGSIVSADQIPKTTDLELTAEPATAIATTDISVTTTAQKESSTTPENPPGLANSSKEVSAAGDGSSPDAVQTLIDAVQELIQTHDQASSSGSQGEQANS